MRNTALLLVAVLAAVLTAPAATATNGLDANECYFLSSWRCCALDPDFRKVCGDPEPICLGVPVFVNGIPQDPNFMRPTATQPGQNGYRGRTLIKDGDPVWCEYYEAFCAPLAPGGCGWNFDEANIRIFPCQAYTNGLSAFDC